MNTRSLGTAVGVAAVLAGAAVAVAPPDAVPSIGARAALVVATLVGGSLAVLGLLGRTVAGPETTALPGPGTGRSARVPGEAVDRRLARAASDADERAAIRERVADLAAARIARREGCTPERAREHLAAGTWTDDERAAGYLAGETPDAGIGAHLRALATGASIHRRNAARAIRAVAALDGADAGGGRARESPPDAPGPTDADGADRVDDGESQATDAESRRGASDPQRAPTEAEP